MPSEFKTITLSLPYRLGGVNCYLLKAVSGIYILIDSGGSNSRLKLEEELKKSGCKSGNLKLIIITHGDFDHTGNAAYLCRKYGSKVAMHSDDLGMVEQGNMFFNRKTGNVLLKTLIKILTPIFFRFGKSERFKPDFYVDSMYDLSEYGLDAKIIHIPGHSKGSIGILTDTGDLFCGDLFANVNRTDRPKLNSIMDDKLAAIESIEKLKNLKIDTVYPGHGDSFSFDTFMHLGVPSK